MYISLDVYYDILLNYEIKDFIKKKCLNKQLNYYYNSNKITNDELFEYSVNIFEEDLIDNIIKILLI